MSKAVLLSIQPKWIEKIARGEKTIEVRKTKPKVPIPFKCYIYCTKTKTPGDLILCKSKELVELYGENAVKGINKGFAKLEDVDLKGKVIGEFVCDYIYSNSHVTGVDVGIIELSCLSQSEYLKYANGKKVYCLHISDLKIYDKPKELKEFMKPCDLGVNPTICKKRDCKLILQRPPQSWCYVQEVENG